MRSSSHNVTIEIFKLIQIISPRLLFSIPLDKIVQFKVQIHFRYNCLAHIGKGKPSAGRGIKYVELWMPKVGQMRWLMGQIDNGSPHI